MKDHLKMKLGVDVKSTRDDIKFLIIELKNKIIETKNGIDIESEIYQKNEEAIKIIKNKITKLEEEKLELKKIVLARPDKRLQLETKKSIKP